MQYDVMFGAAVVITVTNSDDANVLAECLQDVSNNSGFQTEGLNSSVVEVEREREEDDEPDDEYYSLNSADALGQIRLLEDPEEIRNAILREQAHPRYSGGRSGVIDAVEEHLGEVLTDLP